MWKLRLSELEFSEEETRAVQEAVESNWITAGSRTLEFERAFAALTGTSDAVAVANGTAALFLALKALGIKPGDEVLCPSLTFVATAAAIIQCGAQPVFTDIRSLADPTMDPDDAARKITRRTRAILPVHYAGLPCDMDALADLAESEHVSLIEDAAHAPGARYRGQTCGSFGEAGCFSLFGNKNITTAEGGMITTNNPELAARVRRLRSHGMTVTSWDRDRGRPADYDVIEVGYNYRLDDIRAALGLVQIRKLEAINRKRAEAVTLYNRAFAGSDLVLPCASAPWDVRPAFHIYPVVFGSEEKKNGMERSLAEAGIQTSVHYKPIHYFRAFRERFADTHLPVTEDFAARELTLPLFPSMTPDQIGHVVSTVLRCQDDSAALLCSQQMR